MSSTDTGLGNFATLPPELRLCIWDWLFPRHIIGPLKGPPIFKRRRTRLPILRTSKELYAEISHHLYSRISVAIRLNPRKHQWLAFRIQNLGISWLIEEKEDAIQRGFDKFPLQRVPIYIGIHPPNPASPGDLIRLWQNVQSLVNILEHAPSIKITLFSARWSTEGTGNRRVYCVHIKSYCSPILFSRLPISMTTPSAVTYQALAGEIIRRELALKVTVCLSEGYLDELLKTLYDPEILHITALLDYGLSHISIPAAEYLHYFHSISGALAAPYSEETEDLREAILHGFPDVENLPNSKPMRQGWAEFGSGRDIQWGLAKAWNDELVRVGALRPSTIDGADDFSRAHWFIQDLAPWHLFDPAVLEIRTPEQLEEARKEVEATLGKYLDGWGF
ncbi:hypothetical protein BDV34DRAFT_212979 [Aspergillus parasiticus]|uniref:Uncharacterized protein n=1 Tax=Aspergillus parasiticus TaxID=5067 RepID=A0A5N6DNC3_ASPPA|nr:hypothetical protein BDV34DRAFT_212979 [Aspergillus parasiticus]